MIKVKEWLKNRSGIQFEILSGSSSAARRILDGKVFSSHQALKRKHTRLRDIDYAQRVYISKFLEDKINHLKGQVRQEKMSIFQFDLAIADATAGTTGSATVDEQLRTTAQSNELGKTMSVRKLATRQKLLDELEAEFEATKSSS